MRNQKLRNMRPEVPLGCSLGRPRPIHRFLVLPLVICSFPRHKWERLQHFRRSEEELPVDTWPEVSLTGSDVTGREPDRN
jgi:hypothetical protein